MSLPRVCCTLLVASVAAAPFVSCGADKNVAERQAAAGIDAGSNCVRNCTADPGSGAVDCTAGAGYEFWPIWDFEARHPVPPTAAPGTVMPPQPMYFYSDGSSDFMSPFRYQGDASMVASAIERCDSHAALHLQGGPFLTWGGGLGRNLGALGSAGQCQTPGEPWPCWDLAEEQELDVQAERNGLPKINNMTRRHTLVPRAVGMTVTETPQTVDASQWDGISFWGRIGPDSQSGVRVGVGDKYVDEDLSFLNDAKYCRRVRLCDCSLFKPCTMYDGPAPPAHEYCYDPVVDKGPIFNPLATQPGAGASTAADYSPCGQTHCDDDYPAYPNAVDPLFTGRSCTPYTTQNGLTNGYCFNPGEDPNPAESDQRCGDNPVLTVHMTRDWKLYFVPFSEMRQQGWAKRSPAPLDKSGLSMVRFTWDAGWVDFWIDDVSFYRLKR